MQSEDSRNIMRQFEALPGYFQAYTEREAAGIDATGNKHLEFVLHGSWSELYSSIPQDTDEYTYKFLVLARHGQGHHNVGVEIYGTPEWDRYWSFLDGDGHRKWFDAHLTPLGIEQTRETGSTILKPMCKQLGLPQKFFCSPMRRCIETFIGSWSQVLEGDGPAPVQIVENLRETLGEHTCDKRVDQQVVLDNYQEQLYINGLFSYFMIRAILKKIHYGKLIIERQKKRSMSVLDWLLQEYSLDLKATFL